MRKFALMFAVVLPSLALPAFAEDADVRTAAVDRDLQADLKKVEAPAKEAERKYLEAWKAARQAQKKAYAKAEADCVKKIESARHAGDHKSQEQLEAKLAEIQSMGAALDDPKDARWEVSVLDRAEGSADSPEAKACKALAGSWVRCDHGGFKWPTELEVDKAEPSRLKVSSRTSGWTMMPVPGSAGRLWKWEGRDLPDGTPQAIYAVQGGRLVEVDAKGRPLPKGGSMERAK